LLDLGCGNGGKLAELVRGGAGASVGVDISGNFITARPSGLELVQGDLSEPDSVAALAGPRSEPTPVPNALWGPRLGARWLVRLGENGTATFVVEVPGWWQHRWRGYGSIAGAVMAA
jgi:SAM-dependent methyltransferase